MQRAAVDGNNKFLTQFIDRYRDSKTVKILGWRNSSLISQLSLTLFDQICIIVGAIKGNHISLVKHLITEHPPITSTSVHYVFLIKAIKSGNLEIIKFLQSVYDIPWLDADSNSEDDSQILYYTCSTANLLMVEYIMSNRKCKVRDYNDGLKGAARAGDIPLMNSMFTLGATDIDGAMVFAAKGGHLSIVLDMVNRGATNLNLALQYAAKKGNQNLIQKLIELGANVNDEALIKACQGNNLPVFRFLLSNLKQLSENFLIRLITFNTPMSTDILDILLQYIHKSEYYRILMGLVYNNKPLWVIKMLGITATFPEARTVEHLIQQQQLCVTVELIHQGLDYKKYIPYMKQDVARYLLDHFN